MDVIKAKTLPRPRTSLVAAIVFCSIACVTTIQDFVPVRRGVSTEEKTRIAAAVVHDEALQRIRAELKRTVPSLSDAELQRLSLHVVQSTTFGQDRAVKEHSVSVKIVIQDASKGGDQLMDAAVRLIDSVLNDERPPDWFTRDK